VLMCCLFELVDLNICWLLVVAALIAFVRLCLLSVVACVYLILVVVCLFC